MQISKDSKYNNFLSISDISKDEFIYLINLAEDFKNNIISREFKKKVLGLIFNKASTRTRVSFQVAMSRLGGSTIDLNPNTSQIGRGEPIKDTARVLSKYCDVLAIRTFSQEELNEYAKWSTKPIINALTDIEHPCQVLADFLTIKEHFGDFNNLIFTYVGDGNNVANSLILAASLLGIELRIASPKNFEPDHEIIKKSFNLNPKNQLKITNNPVEAVCGANIIYTDVWSSMGQEENKEDKDNNFDGFTIDKNLVSFAKENFIVLHCLPAYRGKEITDEIMESQNSKIFDQAENRMHSQQALLSFLLSRTCK